jgi:multiple sugar transport system substrate-binding protein
MKKSKIFFLSLIIITISIVIWKFTHHSFVSNGNSEKIKITILCENSASIQAMMSLKEEYEKQNPNIDLVFKPNTFEDALYKSNQDFAQHTGLYDIIMQYNFSLSSFVRNKYVYTIKDLSGSIPNETKAFEKDLFMKNWREVGYYYADDRNPSKGELQVAYPFSAHSMLLMYNNDLFEDTQNKTLFKEKFGKELKVPSTWDDFYNISKFFTNKDKGTYGVCIGGASGGYLYYDLLNFIYGFGGQVLDNTVGWQSDRNTKVSLNSPEVKKAFAFHRSLKPFNAGNFSSIDQYEPIRIMKEGKTAMTIVWSDLIYPAIKTDNGFDKRFSFAPIPGNKSAFVGGAYFINRDSKHPDEAFKYILYIMQPITQVKLAQKGLCPASKLIYENPEIQKLPYIKALKVSVDRGGVILDAGADAEMISEVLTTYVQKMWNDELTPVLAVEKASKEIEQKRKEIFSKINN